MSCYVYFYMVDNKFNKKKIERKRVDAASDVLQALFTNGKSPLSEQFQRWRLWRQWPDVVGEELATYTYPVGYQKGCLVIWVDHPARINDLHYIKDVLIKKVNDHLNRQWIRTMRFTTDRQSVPHLDKSDENLKRFFSSPLSSDL